MTDFLCKIKIKIRDYYPKLKIIPFKDYYCLLSYNGNNLSIPLKNFETIFYENEPEIINSDLIYNISLMNYENKFLISKSNLIIPYIRIIQVIKMKKLKYEQQIRLFLEKDIKEKIFGPGVSVGSIFLKFIIELNATKNITSNIFLPNDIIIRNNSKYKLKNTSDSNTNSSITNLSSIKNKEIIKNNDAYQNYRLTTKYSTNKSNEFSNYNCTSINKQNDSKNRYLYTHTSPFALKNYYKNQSEQVIGKQKSKRNYSYRKNYGFLSPNKNVKKLYGNEKYNINLKKYYSRHWNNNKTSIKNFDAKMDNILPNCFSETSIREKKEIKKHKTEKINFKNINTLENNKKIFTIKKEDNNNKKENNSISKSIESNNKTKNNEKNNKIPKKISKKINNNKSHIVKKHAINNNNEIDNSIHKINKKISQKCKTTKNFYKKENNKKRNEKNENGEIKENIENKTTEPKKNLIYENKIIKDLNFIKTVNTQEDLKNNIISLIDYCKNKNKETNKECDNNINKIDSQYLLYREKIVLENKKSYSLQSQHNLKDFKDFIHVKINSKYNNTLFNKMSKVKIKEFNIIKIILNNKLNKKNDPRKILEEKLKQQKQMHILLSLIRDLIKSYGNLSHLYDDDNNKKILIKSLFLRYNIREKDWNNNNNLVDIYNKMINEIKQNKNKENKKDKLAIKEEFKAIKEEEENEIDEDESIIKEKNEIINKEESNNESNDISKEENIDENKEIKDNEIKLILKEENLVNKSNLTKNDNEKNINENNIKDNIYKYDINSDENINTNNISKELLNNKNIIINNFIINK